jgi:hypothetical protein
MFIHTRKLITGTLYQKLPQTMSYHGLSLPIMARFLIPRFAFSYTLSFFELKANSELDANKIAWPMKGPYCAPGRDRHSNAFLLKTNFEDPSCKDKNKYKNWNHPGSERWTFLSIPNVVQAHENLGILKPNESL